MKKLFILLILLQTILKAQDYTVQSIGFTPPNSFLEAVVQVDTDDGFSEFINMGFDFEFYGYTYNKIIGSGNGVLSFNVDLANDYQEYNIPDEFSLPSDASFTVLNSIMLWHDLNVNSQFAIPTTLIGFNTIGVAPNRRFVANYNDAPHFGTPSDSSYSEYSTFQIVLYETSNMIEFYIKQKPILSNWNSGRAVLGIQNEDGTVGIAAPNRNNVVWEAHNEAWRFVPYNAEFVEAFPAAITLCSDEIASETFNLTSVDGIVSGYRTGTMVTYHLTEEEALANINPVMATAFTSSPTIVHARVEETISGLIDVSTVTLDIVFCTDDEDNDGVQNQLEDLNEDGNLANDDTDNDGIPNYLDTDDDNDNVPTTEELNISSGRSHNVIDTDGDGIENYLDNNDDDDAVLTIDEDYNQNGDYTDDDQNNNGIPDYLDPEVGALATHDFHDELTDIVIYPNPTKDMLYLKAPSTLQINSIKIYNATGKLIMETDKLQEHNGIKVSNLPIGYYILEILTSQGVQSKTIIKK